MTQPIHPAADLFPMLADNELNELAADIAEHGLREPIWLWSDSDGTELPARRAQPRRRMPDRRHRTSAPRYDGDSPTAFVVSLNVERRHLTQANVPPWPTTCCRC